MTSSQLRTRLGCPVGPAYAPTQAPEVSARYRRWVGILIWLAVVIAVLVVVAFGHGAGVCGSSGSGGGKRGLRLGKSLPGVHDGRAAAAWAVRDRAITVATGSTRLVYPTTYRTALHRGAARPMKLMRRPQPSLGTVRCLLAAALSVRGGPSAPLVPRDVGGEHVAHCADHVDREPAHTLQDSYLVSIPVSYFELGDVLCCQAVASGLSSAVPAAIPKPMWWNTRRSVRPSGGAVAVAGRVGLDEPAQPLLRHRTCIFPPCGRAPWRAGSGRRSMRMGALCIALG